MRNLMARYEVQGIAWKLLFITMDLTCYLIHQVRHTSREWPMMSPEGGHPRLMVLVAQPFSLILWQPWHRPILPRPCNHIFPQSFPQYWNASIFAVRWSGQTRWEECGRECGWFRGWWQRSAKARGHGALSFNQSRLWIATIPVPLLRKQSVLRVDETFMHAWNTVLWVGRYWARRCPKGCALVHTAMSQWLMTDWHLVSRNL